MSDIKLFRLTAGQATELQSDASDLEKPLQTLIEANLEPLLIVGNVCLELNAKLGQKLEHPAQLPKPTPANCWRASA